MFNPKSYAKDNYEMLLDILRKLCVIPAPSHHEEIRAEFCKNFLVGCGAKNVYIDDAKNVVYPINCENSDEITIFVAHTDTVFPDTEPYPMSEDEEKIHCPGVGDDTASVVVLLMLARLFAINDVKPEKGVVFVLNSCEEGLGNLDGTKELMKKFGSRCARFISFDANINGIYDNCVGSHRYEVEVLTEGGHSFGKFGNKNAICELSKIITRIYDIEVPKINNSVTTYNVGTIEGGTSVNTIAQNAKMLCEYRSDNRECLEIMKNHFLKIFEDTANDKVTVNYKLIGERPCMGNVDIKKQTELSDLCAALAEETAKTKVARCSASTDCNIPLSMGIPSVCMGVYMGNGSHRREEYIIKKSLETGFELAIRTAMKLLCINDI